MKSKKLKVLLAVIIAAAGVVIVNYAGDYTVHEIYAAETQSALSGQISAEISYEAEEEKDSINPVMIIKNTDSTTLDLKTLNFKYYYPSDLDSEEVYNCYYAGTEDGENKNFTNYVNADIKKDNSTDNAFADITFTGGTLNAGQSMIIKGGIHKADWSFYDVGDKSLCSVMCYINGDLVYGEAPDIVMPELDKDIIYNSSDTNIKVNLNGNKFLGIQGLSEGKDYTFDGTTLTINKNSNTGEYDKNFYLMFSNNIRKVLTIRGNFQSSVTERYASKIGGGDFKRGETIEIPVDIYSRMTGYSCESDCRGPYSLQYDTDCFEIIGVTKLLNNIYYDINPASGIVNVVAGGFLDFGMTPRVILVLKVKENSPIGSTRINFWPDKYCGIASGESSIINITK